MAEEGEASQVPLKRRRQPLSITWRHNPEDHNHYENLKEHI
jgi:hypothetical protein